jgi:hypothetical protein
VNTPNHNNSPITRDAGNWLIDRLAAEVDCAVRRQLTGCEIAQIWTVGSRTLFRLDDGCTGDVEVLVNWDVVPEVI